MPIKVICMCGKKFSVKDELAGKKVKCPACQKVLNLSKAAAEKLSPNDQRDFEETSNNDPGNGQDEAIEKFVGMMSSDASGAATSKNKSNGDNSARRKKKAVPEPYDPCSAQLRSVRVSQVRAGISCYFFGFLVIFFAACWAAYVPTLHQGNFAKVMRDLRTVNFVCLIAEVVITIGFGLCLTAPSKTRGRDFLLVAVIGGLLGLLIDSMMLWNPLYSLRIGRWLPQFVLLTTHAAFFLFLRWLGDFLGRSEITSRATRVLVLLAIGAAVWLGVFRAQPPMPFMVMRNPVLLVPLFGVSIVALIGLFSVIRLLSRCREILRTDERAAAVSNTEREIGADDRESKWLSRSDVLKLAIGGGLAAVSLWGWVALYKPGPVDFAFRPGLSVPTVSPNRPSGFPNAGVMPTKPTIVKSSGKTQLTLTGHKGLVANVAFNPDWTRLATASWDKTIKVWDATTAKELLTLTDHSGEVRRVVYSPDGLWLASVSNDKSVKLWDAASGREQRTMTGHTAAVVGVAFSPDGQRLASASDDKTVKVWNVATGRELLNLAGHTQPVNVVAFSPDGKRLASADNDVKLWDVSSGQELLTLKGHASLVMALAFRPDGQQLATVSFDSTVKLWDTTSGQNSHTLKGHQKMAQGVGYHPDGRRLYSIGNDFKVKEWDVTTGVLRRTVQSKGSLMSLTVSSDGKQIAAAGVFGAVEIWDQPTDEPKSAHAGHSGAVTSLAFSPDGQWLASGSSDQTVRIWNATTGQETQTLKDHAGTISAVAYRSDGKSLVSVSSPFGQKGQVKVWDLGSGLDTQKRLFEISGIVAMSADGTRLASAFTDYSIKLWNLDNGQELSPLKGHSGFLSSLSLSRDGKWLASAAMVLGKPGAADYLTKPGEIRVWNVNNGQEISLLGGQTNRVTHVALSPDGQRLASAHEVLAVHRDATVHQNSMLKIWDSKTGDELRTINNHPGAVTSLAFSPDGQQLACASGRPGQLKLWDVTTGREVASCKGHEGQITFLTFNPEGKRLASASADETVKVWDTATGRELLMLGVPAQ